MATSVETSWLFIRQNETVRVFRAGPTWLQLGIAGPQGARRVLRFASEEELASFQQTQEQQLLEDGWHLEGRNVERRSGTDRRRTSRGPERRASTTGDGLSV